MNFLTTFLTTFHITFHTTFRQVVRYCGVQNACLEIHSLFCQFFPFQHFIYSIAGTFGEFDISEQIDNGRIARERRVLGFHHIDTYDETPGVLKLNTVIEFANRRMHGAEKIGVGTKVDKTLTQTVQL